MQYDNGFSFSSISHRNHKFWRYVNWSLLLLILVSALWFLCNSHTEKLPPLVAWYSIYPFWVDCLPQDSFRSPWNTVRWSIHSFNTYCWFVYDWARGGSTDHRYPLLISPEQGRNVLRYDNQWLHHNNNFWRKTVYLYSYCVYTECRVFTNFLRFCVFS